MVRSDSNSWNVRDEHMMDTLDRLLEHHGPDAKGIVWAHNTHVGDARYTDMASAGMVNIGQLARPYLHDKAAPLMLETCRVGVRSAWRLRGGRGLPR